MGDRTALLEAGSKKNSLIEHTKKSVETANRQNILSQSKKLSKSEYEHIQSLICYEEGIYLVQTSANTEEISYCIEL